MFAILPQMLAHRAETQPEHAAFVFLPQSAEAPTITVAYGELHIRAAAVASMLIKNGTAVGDRVLLAFANGHDFIAAFFGCLYAAAIPVPVSPVLVSSEAYRIAAIAKDCSTRLGLAGTESSLVAVRSITPALRWKSIERIENGLVPDLRGLSSDPASVAYLQYTSGSTANPKGVMVSHENVFSNLEAIQEGFGHTTDSVSANWLPFFHDMGLVYGVLMPLRYGFMSVVMSPYGFLRRPGCWLKAISCWHATHSGAPDFAYELCAERVSEEECRTLDLGSWRIAFNGAERVRAATIHRFVEKFSRVGFRAEAFYACYGLAEATLKVTGGKPRFVNIDTATLASGRPRLSGDAGGVQYVGCGRPAAKTVLMIVNPETRTRSRNGYIGEVWVHSTSVALGYWGRPHLSKQVFRARINGSRKREYLRTGDLGFVQQGELFIAGRLKDLVIIRGANFHADDIEAAVRAAAPTARLSAVCAFSVEVEGAERLVIVHAPEQRAKADYAAIGRAVRTTVADTFGVPVYALVLVRPHSIPMSPNGKIQRRRCRELFCAGSLEALASFVWPVLRDTPHPKPMTDLTDPLEWLSITSARLAGVQTIVPDLPLISQGIDSLMAADLSRMVHEHWAMDLNVGDFLDQRPARELARKLLQTDKRTMQVPASHSSEPIAELSQEEKRHWYLDRVQSTSNSLSLAASLFIYGELDLSSFERALKELGSAHENLRVVFPIEYGRPVRRVIDEAITQLEIVDLSALADRDKLTEVEKQFGNFSRAKLNLEHGPLWGTLIVLMSPSETVLAVRMHHLIGDAWSFRIFFSDLFALYDGRRLEGIRQVRRFLPHVKLGAKRDHTFWAAQLAEGKSLNLGRPDRVIREPYVREIPCRLSGDLLENVRVLAVDAGVTVFTVLLAAFYVALKERTGEEDLTILCPFSGRTCSGQELVIGSLATPLPVRLRIPGNATVREVLSAAGRTVRECLNHQNISLAEVAEEAKGIGKWPVFFGCLKEPIPTFSSDKLTAKVAPYRKFATDLPLALNLLIYPGEIVGSLSFDLRRLSEKTVEGFFENYIRILEVWVDAPGLIASGTTSLDKQTITIAATFTADSVLESLKFWSEFLGLSWNLELAPYNQVFQLLLDPSSVVASNYSGLNVVLIRFDDWCQFDPLPDGDWLSLHLKRNAEELVNIVKMAEGGPLVIVICPESCRLDSCPGGVDAVNEAEEVIATHLTGVHGVHVFRRSDIAHLYPVGSSLDGYSERLGVVPYTQEFFAAVGSTIARYAYALTSPPYKVIVTDCDGTLWCGSVAEDGPDGIWLDHARQAVQEFLIEQQSSGVLLCLCSKNHETDVLEVFRRHRGMALQLENIAAWRINWGPKSENLRSLAAELNLGLDSFVFLDNDPRECAEVTERFPEVLCVPLPSNEQRIPLFLRHIWPLRQVQTLSQTPNRSQQYRAEAERKRFRGEFVDIETFLSRLQLEVKVAELTASQVERMSELTLRVNQFNSMGTRYSPKHLETVRQRIRVYAVEACDRFGDYGLIGGVFCRLSQSALIVENLVLSCRALGRGVECRVLSWMAALASTQGLHSIEIRYVDTGRNRRVCDFLTSVASSMQQLGPRESVYYLEAGTAENLVASQPPYKYEPQTGGLQSGNQEHGRARDVDGRKFVEIANSLSDAASILMRIRHSKNANAKAGCMARSDDVKARITQIWSEVLAKSDNVRTDEDFFKLGGSSLSAMDILVRLSASFGVEVPIRTLYAEELTIENLSRIVEEAIANRALTGQGVDSAKNERAMSELEMK